MLLFISLSILAFHSEPAQADNKGSDNTKEWSLQEFPNPARNPAACGRDPGQRTFVCDPDHILTQQEGNCSLLQPSLFTMSSVTMFGIVPNLFLKFSAKKNEHHIRLSITVTV